MLHLESIADLKAVPGINQWCLPEILPRGGTTLIHAPTKTGKSFFVWGLLSEMNRNGECLKEPISDLPETVYLTEESADDVVKKLTACQMPDDAWIKTLRSVNRTPAQFDWQFVIGAIAEEHDNRIARGDRGIDLVVIDTLLTFGATGIDINDYGAAGNFMSWVDRLKGYITGISVLLVHHTRKASGGDDVDSALGSTALTALSDGVFALTRDGNIAERRWLKGRTRWSGESSRCVEWVPAEGLFVPVTEGVDTSSTNFLDQFLQQGPMTTKELEAAYTASGMTASQQSINSRLNKGRGTKYEKESYKRDRQDVWRLILGGWSMPQDGSPVVAGAGTGNPAPVAQPLVGASADLELPETPELEISIDFGDL